MSTARLDAHGWLGRVVTQLRLSYSWLVVTQGYFLRPSFPLHCSYHLELSAEHCDSCWL